MTIEVNEAAVRIECYSLGPYGTNTYLVTCPKTDECVIIDAPGEAEKVIGMVASRKVGYILMTHNHVDHVESLVELKEALKVPVAAHRSSVSGLPLQPDRYLEDGEILKVGELDIKVIHTPGHTPGSTCFLTGKYLISGDTLFNGGPGNTRSSADLARILESLTTKLFVLPDDTRVFPGHGGSTTIRQAKEEYAVFASKSHKSGLHGDIVWLKS